MTRRSIDMSRTTPMSAFTVTADLPLAAFPRLRGHQVVRISGNGAPPVPPCTVEDPAGRRVLCEIDQCSDLPAESKVTVVMLTLARVVTARKGRSTA
jgi:hypothetical protein